MISSEKMIVAMGAVRDQFIEVISAHEREDHRGLPCMDSRATSIAYLMHCVGLRTHDDVEFVGLLLKEYNAACPECEHGIDFGQDGIPDDDDAA